MKKHSIGYRGNLCLQMMVGFLVSVMFVGLAVEASQQITLQTVREMSEILQRSTQGVPVFDLVYSSDGTRLYGAHGNSVSIWDATSGDLLDSWPAHASFAAGIGLSLAGDRLATVGSDSVLKLWNTETGSLIRSLSPAGTHAVAFSPDGTLIASGDTHGVLRVWVVESGELMHETASVSGVFSVAFSPDGSLLATAHGLPDFAVRIWSIDTGKLIWESFENDSDAHVIAFSPNGEMIASVAADAQIIVWDVTSGVALQAMRRGRTPLFELLFISDELIATGDGDGTIRFWNPQTGQLVHFLSPCASEICALALSSDGCRLAAASFGMRIRLFEASEE